MHWIDPNHLPGISGRIEAILYNEHGEADGLLLNRLREVHIPPHLAARAGRALRAGEHFAARYLKPKSGDVFVAVSVSLPSGRQIVDEGPHGHEPPAAPARTAPVHLHGQVRARIHAPRGEVSGAVLDDGTIVRFHPRGNEDIASHFEPGSRVDVWGEGFRKQGTLVIRLAHVARAS